MEEIAGTHIKQFKVNYSKIKTTEDVIALLKAFRFNPYWYEDNCPEHLKEIYEKGFLIEL